MNILAHLQQMQEHRVPIPKSMVGLSLLFVTAHVCHAQNGDEQCVTFLPGGGGFPPPTAHQHEPHVGLRKQAGSSRLKIDIGSTIDLVEYRIGEAGERLRVGADFFAYALSTGYQGKRLQIVAVDGYFGGHASYLRADLLSFRARVMHASGHFLDGNYDAARRQWRDRDPIPFARDFAELLVAMEPSAGTLAVRVYAGTAYAFLIRPQAIRRWSFLGGAEVHSGELIGPVFGRPAHMFLAHHVSLVGIPEYTAANTTEAGIKFGSWGGSGVKIYVSYVSGPDVFSQYFDLRRREWGIGFSLHAR